MSALPAKYSRARSGSRRASTSIRLAGFVTSSRCLSLQAVAQAVWSERYLRPALSPRRAIGNLRQRKLGPLGLVLKGGIWYLVAQSGTAIRTYRVAQILDAEIAEEAFARPKDFDLAGLLGEGVARLRSRVSTASTRDVRLSPKGCIYSTCWPPRREAATAAKPMQVERCSLPIETIAQAFAN